MTYEEALGYMKKASAKGSVLGLERITELLRLMGDPQDKVNIIHVSGTNGKGSFGAMLTSILRATGYVTGSFSSPAITEVTDSFRINGIEISHDEFASLIGYIAEICKKMNDQPTEFEILTAAAYELFVRRHCDVAVVECGMGGDLDSTNVVASPMLSVITNVQSDHCAFLGNTISEIASHKSGIIKKHRPVYFGGDSAEALEIIRRQAEKMESKLYVHDISGFSSVRFSLSGLEFNWYGQKLSVPLLGTYQLNNVVNVLNCVEIIRNIGLGINDLAIKIGLAETKWHGRFEILSREPLIIFDGSHNPDGINCAADSIGRYFGINKIALLIGVMADKEYGLYADMLGQYIDCVFAVKPDNPRALGADILADTFTKKGIRSQGFANLPDGVRTAYNYAKNKNIPLIALGSLYMYREFTSELSKLS